jgi:hypothetical protein
MKAILVLLALVLLSSCAVHKDDFKYNKKAYDVNKHHVIKDFDKYMLNKYKLVKYETKN